MINFSAINCKPKWNINSYKPIWSFHFWFSSYTHFQYLLLPKQQPFTCSSIHHLSNLSQVTAVVTFPINCLFQYVTSYIYILAGKIISYSKILAFIQSFFFNLLYECPWTYKCVSSPSHGRLSGGSHLLLTLWLRMSLSHHWLPGISTIQRLKKKNVHNLEDENVSKSMFLLQLHRIIPSKYPLTILSGTIISSKITI